MKFLYTKTYDYKDRKEVDIMLGGRRRGGMSLGRVAKKAAVATVVSRAVNNAMDNHASRNFNQGMNQNMNQQQPVQQQPQQAMTNVCQSCNSGNPQHAKFCLNCGNGIGVVAAQATGQPAQLSSCPGCKASLVGIEANFCPYCRTAVR